MEEIIKADKAGNFKIPRKIKNALKLKKNDNLFVFSGRDSIIIKKVQQKSLKERFERLTKDVSGKFKKNRVAKDDILKAVEWARR